MNKTLLHLTLGLSLCAGNAANAELPAQPQQMQAKVAQVIDGDTIMVVNTKQKRYRVQLDGIDAPELVQPYGQASKKHLERRIRGRSVILMWRHTDKDGTLIAKVMLNNGDINLLQVRTGSAWSTGRVAVTYGGNGPKRYAAAQAAAREKHMGLWRDAAPLEPAEWRKQHAPK